MAKSILEAMFYGKIAPWERKVKNSGERLEIESIIKNEKEFFRGELLPELYHRIEGLETLYTQASEDEEIDIFTHGFKIGALVMLEVLSGQEDIINE